ncbi:MAG: transposase [Candidatus Eremiobacterota bacterium]
MEEKNNSGVKKKYGRQRLKDFNYIGTGCYFLTICTDNKKSIFISPEIVNDVKEILFQNAEKYRFDIICFCFMPDHLHILTQGTHDESDLGKFISAFKQKTGFDYKKKNGIILWQKSYYDRIVRKYEDIDNICRYIIKNPVRRGIVKDYKGYNFSWCKYFSVQSD